jgi:UDP-N-acetylmuramate--alanine ligase
MFKSFKKIHFVGIGGIGMSGMAEILLNKGYLVSGSDKSLNEITDRLSRLGVQITEGHSEKNITDDTDIVVYTSAVTIENPEIREAIKRKIPAVKRSEMLAEIIRTKYGICIAGTHGKTTTTSMMALTLLNANLDPTIIVGGILRELGNSNAKLGNGEFAVVEADEFDRTFLKLTPAIAVLTTLEAEHLDTYNNLDDIKEAFIKFANKIPFYGFVALCIDEPNLSDILPFINKKVLTYGLTKNAEVRATEILHHEFSSEFKVQYLNEQIGVINLKIPGKHNIKNALAVIAIAVNLGINFETIKKSLESFRGALRRFEIKYDNDITVIDDYAHHPTEVSATLSGIKNGWNRRLVAVFQPHLFTRTKEFAEEFGKAFLISDIFICTDVYPAREKPIEGVTGELITKASQKLGHKNVFYEPDKNKIPEILMNLHHEGDIIITMGAGDIYKYGEKFIELKKEIIEKQRRN